MPGDDVTGNSLLLLRSSPIACLSLPKRPFVGSEPEVHFSQKATAQIVPALAGGAFNVS